MNHGSRSATWRQALLDLEAKVRPAILTNQAIQGIKTAHMEYTEPSIATRLKEFDAAGFTDIVIVPVFLTVSAHTFDDIPTIIGKKTDPQSLETMKLEKIERYQPKARTVIAPNLDFTDVLKTNVLRRVRALSTNPAEEGLVLIAYGDSRVRRVGARALRFAHSAARRPSIGVARESFERDRQLPASRRVFGRRVVARPVAFTAHTWQTSNLTRPEGGASLRPRR
ncbi:MAG: CbiX/SirB N-terminal domain-containing protein [Verrucomicrobiota bacterium]